MNKMQEQVRDFRRAMGYSTPDRIIDTKEINPREMLMQLRLILEETEETIQAAGARIVPAKSVPVGDHRRDPHDIEFCTDLGKPAPFHMPEVVDGICDMLFVTFGLACGLGVDIEPFFELVHEANMKKGPGPVRESDGKKLKPEGWTPPDISGALVRARAFDTVVDLLPELAVALLDETDPDRV